MESTPPSDLQQLGARAELLLLDRADWVSAEDLCLVLGIRQRLLRADLAAKRPGLLDAFAVSGHRGFLHARFLADDDYLARRRTLVRHAVAELRKVRAWSKARHAVLTGLRPHQIERHTGQALLPLSIATDRKAA